MENKDTSMILKAEKLVYGGAALTHLPEGKAAMLWNALPGEEVRVAPAKKRRGVYELWPSEIIAPSVHRQEPNEPHFGSCSPWQIMDFDYENLQKAEIAREAFQRILARLPTKDEFATCLEFLRAPGVANADSVAGQTGQSPAC